MSHVTHIKEYHRTSHVTHIKEYHPRGRPNILTRNPLGFLKSQLTATFTVQHLPYKFTVYDYISTLYMYIYIYTFTIYYYMINTAREASWRRGFDPYAPLFFKFVPLSRTNPACWISTKKTNCEFAGVDTSGRVRHPPYSKRLFVRYPTATFPIYIYYIEC